MNTEEFKNRVIPFAGKLYPMMRQFLKGDEDTKDALQDLMLKLWNKRGELETVRNVDAYIVTMAKNHCLDTLKKKKILSLDETNLKIPEVPAPDTGVENREKIERIHKVIDSLPEKYREVIRYRDIDGFSFTEITALTGMEEPHLRVILSRSRMKVREELVKIYNYEQGTTRKITQEVL